MSFVGPCPSTCLAATDDDAAAVDAGVVDAAACEASDTTSTYLLVAHQVKQGYCSRSNRCDPC